VTTQNLQPDFLSIDNFQLAWQRVLRSTRAETKDRIAFRVFASGLDHNLRQIIDEIGAGIYRPSPAPKIYLPKQSRTLRTIPVLTVPDRIVYQAIVNLIVREARADLSVFANRSVFAHLCQSQGSLFILEPWRKQFPRFSREYRRIWSQGNRWVAEADISSFYASISHDLIRSLITDRWVADGQALSLLAICLETWMAHEPYPGLSTGLPEGYEASDLLATLFLLPVDEVLARKFRYLRYVDDMRVLAPDRDTASVALVTLDIELKARGLVLQTKKTGVREVDDLEGEENRLRRQLSRIAARRGVGAGQQDELREVFFRAWNQLDEDPDPADSAIAFALYRLEPDTTVRNIAIRLLEILPWRSGVINHYLRKFQSDQEVIQALARTLRGHRVYAWHLANCMRTIAEVADANTFRDLAQQWVANSSLRWFQRLAAVEALQNDQDSHIALYSAISTEISPIVKAALVVACAFQAYDTGSKGEVARLIRGALDDQDHDVKRLGIWLHHQFVDIGWPEIGFQGALGPLQDLVPELAGQPAEAPCFVKDTLRRQYEVQVADRLDFQVVFEDYPGTVLDLRRAVPYYHTDPDRYVGFINSFNHRVAVALQPVLGSQVPRGQFDNMLSSSEFKGGVPQVALYFGLCNDIRNRTSGFHPWATALGTWAQPLDHAKKEELHRGLKLAYQEFVTVYQSHAGIS